MIPFISDAVASRVVASGSAENGPVSEESDKKDVAPLRFKDVVEEFRNEFRNADTHKTLLDSPRYPHEPSEGSHRNSHKKHGNNNNNNNHGSCGTDKTTDKSDSQHVGDDRLPAQFKADLKNILITGGNAGIGYALCRQLVAEKNCRVFMGSRNLERGQAAVEGIRESVKEAITKINPDLVTGMMTVLDDRLHLVQLDVSNKNSIALAVETVKRKLEEIGREISKSDSASKSSASKSSSKSKTRDLNPSHGDLNHHNDDHHSESDSDSDEKLFAVINNAGIGFETFLKGESEADGYGDAAELLATNFYGVKHVSEAFLPLLRRATNCAAVERSSPSRGNGEGGNNDGNNGKNTGIELRKNSGRIINVSSGGAASWIFERNSDHITEIFTNPKTTWQELEDCLEYEKLSWPSDEELEPNVDANRIYCLSKAGVNAYTQQQARMYPHLTCVSINPGFIDTNMSRGYGAKLTPEQGTLSLMKCIFGEAGSEVVSGHYYDSDGLRAPLTVPRNPGMPEYQGEKNPKPEMYRKPKVGKYVKKER